MLVAENHNLHAHDSAAFAYDADRAPPMPQTSAPQPSTPQPPRPHFMIADPSPSELAIIAAGRHVARVSFGRAARATCKMMCGIGITAGLTATKFNEFPLAAASLACMLSSGGLHVAFSRPSNRTNQQFCDWLYAERHGMGYMIAHRKDVRIIPMIKGVIAAAIVPVVISAATYYSCAKEQDLGMATRPQPQAATHIPTKTP